MTPTKATWLEESRAAYLRLKTERSNIYVENRLPSSACNPYLALAGTLAAGIDGLERKLQCPIQDDPTAPFIPKTLEAAASALEEDHILIRALGEDFVNAFLCLVNKTLKDKTEKQLENIECQRSIYFHCI
ncbi:unnamed protein product [Candidula unifasciata]|uniref:Lengsin n=1 Tax=Candidula unifasciata TaxID=100452 RepID=A0A8S3ZUG1_9EUPU|nr:unnamed protein product [Candidula unifasciata]